MFLPPDERAIPPRWEPPRRKSPAAKRQEDAAIALIVLVSLFGLFAPIGGGTVVAMVWMLMRALW